MIHKILTNNFTSYSSLVSTTRKSIFHIIITMDGNLQPYHLTRQARLTVKCPDNRIRIIIYLIYDNKQAVYPETSLTIITREDTAQMTLGKTTDAIKKNKYKTTDIFVARSFNS